MKGERCGNAGIPSKGNGTERRTEKRVREADRQMVTGLDAGVLGP